ncbi:MAG: FeoB-associated Cys-rich membrane protein [Bacteroidaceae bacterium]|nr:FeoB-associated Cys-rich membrane protein [Bacteroidaceae bacterium]
MNIQLIIVYIVLVCVAFFLIRYIYRQVTSKNSGCNCGSCSHCCPRTGEKECHCSNTQK